MLDREAVINDLQDAVNDDWMWRHADYYALTMERALAMLKKQQKLIDEITQRRASNGPSIDREKVIKEFEEICGYTMRPHEFRVLNDVLVLLKEQETIFLRDGHHVRCMHCGEYWCDSDREGNPFPMNFCPHCGRQVKWGA